MILRRLTLGLVVAALAMPSHAAPLGAIFVIALENHNLTQPAMQTAPQPLRGNPAAPFQNSLMTPGNPNARHAAWASAYHNVRATPAGTVHIHPSEANYLWANAGDNFGVRHDADPGHHPKGGAGNLIAAPSLTGLLAARGIAWRSYQEDIEIPVAGVNVPGTVPRLSFAGVSPGHANPYNGSHRYGYAAKHNPPVFFTDSNDAAHAADYVPLTRLQRDLDNDDVARYNWITPDLYNDSHTALPEGFLYHGTRYTGDQAAVAQGDNFLATVVPRIEASQAFKDNGAIVIWWDETEGGDGFGHTLEAIVISPSAKGNAYESTLPYTHSSDLLTLAKIFQLGRCLGDSCAPGTNDLTDLFVAGTIPEGY